MSRMINNLNSAQRTTSNKYSMALENAQAETLQGQQEFPGLSAEPNARFPFSASQEVPAESGAGAALSVKNSFGIAALVLGVLLAITISMKALSIVSSDKNQTVKLAQIVAKQNREIKNLESMITNMQSGRAADVERLTKSLKQLDKQVAENGKDVSEMVVDAKLTRSMIEEIKINQKHITNKLADVNKEIELIINRP